MSYDDYKSLYPLRSESPGCLASRSPFDRWSHRQAPEQSRLYNDNRQQHPPHGRYCHHYDRVDPEPSHQSPWDQASTTRCQQLRTPLLGQHTTERERKDPIVRRPWFGEGSMKSAVFSLTNGTLGAGIVSVPFAMMSLGIGVGSLTILLLAVASTTATKALVNVLDHTAVDSFESMAYLAGGSFFSLFVQLILLLFNFSAAVGYLICMGDIFDVLITAYDVETFLPLPLHFLTHRAVFLTLVTLILLLPLCLVRRLSRLRLAAVVGLAALELLVVVTFVLVFQKGLHPTLGSYRWLLPRPKEAVSGFPLLVFAFSCHSNAPSIYAELENQSYRRMANVATRSVITAYGTYMVMGVSGFLIFGYTVGSNILTNFTADLQNSHLLLIAFIGILIGVILSYPMNIFPCRSSLESLFRSNGIAVDFTTSLIIAIGLVIANLFVALLVPSLASLFSLTGSVCGGCVAFIFPGAFVLRLLPCSLWDPRKIKALILVVVGVVIAIFGTGISVRGINGDSDSLIVTTPNPMI